MSQVVNTVAMNCITSQFEHFFNEVIRQMKTLNRFFVRAALAAMYSLFVCLAPDAAFAAPPATVASCAGIKAAYPILGTQCETNYSQINHAPANAEERAQTFRARRAVLIIFRKALLCNGMYGAKKSIQQSFSSGEEGHLVALDGVRTSMISAQDPDIPPAYTSEDLQAVRINKQQCK